MLGLYYVIIMAEELGYALEGPTNPIPARQFQTLVMNEKTVNNPQY